MTDDTKDPIAAAVEAARAKYPNRKRLIGVDTPAGILVLGVPDAIRYEAALAMGFSDDKAEKAIAQKMLLLACAVAPSPDEVSHLIHDPEGFPGLYRFAAVINACSELSGASKAETAKK